MYRKLFIKGCPSAWGLENCAGQSFHPAEISVSLEAVHKTTFRNRRESASPESFRNLFLRDEARHWTGCSTQLFQRPVGMSGGFHGLQRSRRCGSVPESRVWANASKNAENAGYGPANSLQTIQYRGISRVWIFNTDLPGPEIQTSRHQSAGRRDLSDFFASRQGFDMVRALYLDLTGQRLLPAHLRKGAGGDGGGFRSDIRMVQLPRAGCNLDFRQWIRSLSEA